MLVDVYRWATWPYRFLAHSHAARSGKLPVAILFYHRVADDDPNSWTMGTRAFQRQIDWLQRNFDLVSLEEAQSRIRSGFNNRPTVTDPSTRSLLLTGLTTVNIQAASVSTNRAAVTSIPPS